MEYVCERGMFPLLAGNKTEVYKNILRTGVNARTDDRE
jgi:hypothetical protein